MRSAPYLVVVSLALCAAAEAQSPPVSPQLTLTEAWAFAERQSPRLVDARAGIRLAEASVTLAEARPNPVVSVASEGYPLSEPQRPPFFSNQQLAVRADVEVETAGRRGLRSHVAVVGLEAARATSADGRRRLRLEVAHAYLGVVLASADDAVARAVLGDVDRMLTINTARFEQGELAGIELRRLRVERQRFADDVFATELALRNARAALLSVMGANPLDQPFEAVDTFDGPVSAAVPSVAAPPRADLRAARLDIDRARAALVLERATRAPSVSVGGGWMKDFGRNAAIVEVSVPVPLFNRNAAGIKRASAEIEQATARAGVVEATVSLETQLARNGLDIAQRRVTSIEQDYLRSAGEARDIVLASYRSGAATLIDYLDAERVWREAQRARNRARFDYRLAQHQLQSMLGVDIVGSESR